MTKKYTMVVIIAILICSFTQAQIKTPAQIVKNVKTKITEIRVDELKNKMDSQHQFTLIDVRTEKEYLAGHIENAVWLPRGFIEFKIQKLISDPDREIIIYCKRGSGSALSTYTLMEMGYNNVLNLDGGFEEWVNSGNSIYNYHGELGVINFEKLEEE
ncbi:MAG: rhodanese-like domain-containing protein [Ignavibacteriaceae bacterium]|nr:rhodanese-like domain-containing protein [Ignavibacteriaceae bacterium]